MTFPEFQIEAFPRDFLNNRPGIQLKLLKELRSQNVEEVAPHVQKIVSALFNGSAFLHTLCVTEFSLCLQWLVKHFELARAGALLLVQKKSSASYIKSLNSLRWSCSVLYAAKNIIVADESGLKYFNDFVAVQAVLFQNICYNKKAEDQAFRIFHHTLLNKAPKLLNYYLQFLQSKASCANSNLQNAVFRYCQRKNISIEEFIMKSCVDSYISLYSNAKVLSFNEAAGYSYVLKSLDLASFQKLCLPSLTKLFLRSPSVASTVLLSFSTFVSFDVSEVIPSFTKYISASLIAKEDWRRLNAIKTLTELSRNIGQSKAGLVLSDELMKLIEGKGTKITNWELRLNVTDALKQVLLFAPLDASAAASLFTRGAALVKREPHEQVKDGIVGTLAILCKKNNEEINKQLIVLLQETLPLKAKVSVGLRPMFLHLLASIPQDHLKESFSILVPVLDEIVADGKKNKNLVHSLVNAMIASKVLLSLSLSECKIDLKKESDPMKDFAIYFTPKLVNTASQNDLFCLVDLSILNAHRELGWVDCLVQLLLHTNSEVRRYSKEKLKMGDLNVLDMNLVTAFVEAICKVASITTIKKEGEATERVCDKVNLLYTLVTMAKSKDLNDNQSHCLCLSLISAYLHCNIDNSKGLLKSMNALDIEPEIFVRHNLEQLENMVYSNISSENPVNRINSQTILRFLVAHAAGPCLLSFVTHALDLLSNKEILNIGEYEYGVFMTKEGEPYDKSILELASRSNTKRQNVKKTSKLYGDDDDWLDKKKTTEAPKLTKHQEEKLAEQMIKEKSVRSFVNGIEKQVDQAITILSVIIKSHSDALKGFAGSIIRVILPLFQGHLVSRRIQDLWIELAHISSERFRPFSKALAFGTLRLALPIDPIPDAWNQEFLGDLILRLIDNVCSLVDKSLFSTTDYVYSFEFLKLVLFNSGASAKTLKSTMHIIDTMSKTFGLLEDYPRKELLLLLQNIVLKMDFLRQQALKDLETVCSNAETLEDYELEPIVKNLLHASEDSRHASIQALSKLELFDKIENLVVYLLVLKYDEKLSEKATAVWEDNEFEIHEGHCESLAEICETIELDLQEMASKALVSLLSTYQDRTHGVITAFISRFEVLMIPSVNEYDKFGNITKAAAKDPWENRVGISKAIKACSPIMHTEETMPLFDMLIKKGFADVDSRVRTSLVDTAMQIVDDHGENAKELLPIFENYLNSPAQPTEEHDRIREAVIILLGAIARHLPVDDPKVLLVINQLLDALKTPSQSVQVAVAKCLPPLMPAIKKDGPRVSEVFKNLQTELLEGSAYSTRKGAAYGLAGVVKGCGIISLREQNVIPLLTEAIQSKDKAMNREGSLFAFETLIATLGRMFEPYIIRVLPHLLVCMGDTDENVRYAANDTAAAIVTHLKESRSSGPGVKLVLPSLLRALEDKAWRTKLGAVQMLGAMSHCAPDQLSSSLPQIVPRLIEVLADSHPKVQSASQQALRQIGSVIKNPEIQAIVSELLDAIAHPTQKTSACLGTLLNTNFVHFIDAPSLALIMPVLQRALKQRDTPTKMKASQILGNMASLTNHKDLAPYLPDILPGLKIVLVDPNPEVREASAKAMGSMVSGMGEENFSDLIPWLVETLKSDASAVDRSGAAQGLSEVFYGLGVERLSEFIPELVSNTDAAKGHIRQGFLMVFVHLPTTFGPELKPFIGSILPSILKGLADEYETVRDTALEAGQMIVNNYADTCLELFLPELLTGMVSDSWRIRFSSVHLLGDLLYHLSGAFGYQGTQYANDDDNLGTLDAQQQLMTSLGEERAAVVFSMLYMSRTDVNGQVREVAVHIWKIVVYNTVTLMRSIMKTFLDKVFLTLASGLKELRIMAAQALEECLRRCGVRIMADILPLYEACLNDEDEKKRQGVCLGLVETLNVAGTDNCLFYIDEIIPCVNKALCDSSAKVRQAAADVFIRLHHFVGGRVIEDVFPGLMQKLSDEVEGPWALDSLRHIMSLQSGLVLSYIIPYLTVEPMTKENAHILSQLVSLAGSELNEYIDVILRSMIQVCSEGDETFVEEAEQIVLAISSFEGVNLAVSTLLETLKNENSNLKLVACRLSAAFCQHTAADYSHLRVELISKLLLLFDDQDDICLNYAWEAVSAIANATPKDDQPDLVPSVFASVARVARNRNELRGFSINKGIEPLVPMFLHTLVNGSSNSQETAAKGLGLLINLTPLSFLSSSLVIKITGRLIFRCGNGGATMPRVHTLNTLKMIIVKVGAQVKTFLSQLQRTFVKCLNDVEKTIRDSSRFALARLSCVMAVTPVPVDQLVTLVITTSKAAVDDTIRESLLLSLFDLVKKLPAKLKPATIAALHEYILEILEDPTYRIQQCGALCLRELCPFLESDDVVSIYEDAKGLETVKDKLIVGACLCHVDLPNLTSEFTKAAPKLTAALSESSNVAEEGANLYVIEATILLLHKTKPHANDIPRNLLACLVPHLQNSGSKGLALQIVKDLAKLAPSFVRSKIFQSLYSSPIYNVSTGPAGSFRGIAKRTMHYMTLALIEEDGAFEAYIMDESIRKAFLDHKNSKLESSMNADSDDEF